MGQQYYQGVAVYHAKMKTTILCRNLNPDILMYHTLKLLTTYQGKNV